MNRLFLVLCACHLILSGCCEDENACNPDASFTGNDCEVYEYSGPNEIFKRVEEMPVFPCCNVYQNVEERDSCTAAKMENYIFRNLEYPREALERGVEGIVVIQYVLGIDSTIQNVSIVRDLEFGCGQAAQVLINNMNCFEPKWSPGKQRGRIVPVLITQSVEFKR